MVVPQSAVRSVRSRRRGCAPPAWARDNWMLLKPLFPAVVTAVALLLTSPVAAHEPLWGETPSVFGFGVIHPEVRFGYRDAGSTRRGGVRARMWEQETMIQFAPTTALNLMIEIPWM